VVIELFYSNATINNNHVQKWCRGYRGGLKMSPQNNTFQIEMLDNGIDSFKKAIKALDKFGENEISKSAKYALKDAIIYLHHALEVLFKCMVEFKMEALLYDDIDAFFSIRLEQKIGRKSKSNKKPNTISYYESFKRVVVLYEVDIDSNFDVAIARLNEYRNSLKHHRIEKEYLDVKFYLTTVLVKVIPMLQRQEEIEKKLAVIEQEIDKLRSLFNHLQLQRVIDVVNYVNSGQYDCYEVRLDFEKKLNSLGYRKKYFDDISNTPLEISNEPSDDEVEFIFEEFISAFSLRSIYRGTEEKAAVIDYFWNKNRDLCLLTIETFVRDNLAKIISLQQESEDKKIHSGFSNIFVSKSYHLKKKIVSDFYRLEAIIDKTEALYSNNEQKSNLKLANKEFSVDVREVQLSYTFNKLRKLLKEVFEKSSLIHSNDDRYHNIMGNQGEDSILQRLDGYSYDLGELAIRGLYGDSANEGWGTIDGWDEIADIKIEFIESVEDSDKLIVYFSFSMSTQMYTDGMWINIGYVEVFARGEIDFNMTPDLMALEEVENIEIL